MGLDFARWAFGLTRGASLAVRANAIKLALHAPDEPHARFTVSVGFLRGLWGVDPEQGTAPPRTSKWRRSDSEPLIFRMLFDVHSHLGLVMVSANPIEGTFVFRLPETYGGTNG